MTTEVMNILRSISSQLYAFALGLGGPGLFFIALTDSSFLSIPEGNDILIVILSTGRGWDEMSYYVAMTILGSVSGCALLYLFGRRGGGYVQSWFRRRRIEDIKHLYQKWGLWTIFVPAILPPPTPFKIFVLSAGVFEVPFSRFLLAVSVGRSIRYFMWGVLAVLYGEAVREFMVQNLHKIGTILIILFLGAIAGYIIIWLRTRRKTPGQETT
ncbi:MAG: YqaA family protein [Acidobacteriota bacterium]